MQQSYSGFIHGAINPNMQNYLPSSSYTREHEYKEELNRQLSIVGTNISTLNALQAVGIQPITPTQVQQMATASMNGTLPIRMQAFLQRVYQGPNYKGIATGTQLANSITSDKGVHLMAVLKQMAAGATAYGTAVPGIGHMFEPLPIAPSAGMKRDRTPYEEGARVSKIAGNDYNRDLTDLINPDLSTDFVKYWSNLHRAVRPMPPLFRGGARVPFKFQAWSGYVETTVNVGQSSAMRYCPTPYVNDQPGFFIESDIGAGLAGSVPAGTFDVAVESAMAIGQPGYFNDGTVGTGNVTSITNSVYQDQTQTLSGYASNVDIEAPSKFGIGASVAEYSGGFILAKVTVSNGATAQIAAIGQNQSRNLGFQTLNTQTVNSSPGQSVNTIENIAQVVDHDMWVNSFDYYCSKTAATAGGLKDLVMYDDIVAGTDESVIRYYVMPIVPPACNLMPLLPSGFGAALWNVAISGYQLTPSNTGNATTQSFVAPQIPLSIDIIGTQITYTTSIRERVMRCRNNPTQSLYAGMPAFEVVRADDESVFPAGVRIQLTAKHFYNFVTPSTHACWNSARQTALSSGPASESLRAWCAPAAGRGSTPEGAVMDAQQNAMVIRQNSEVSSTANAFLNQLHDTAKSVAAPLIKGVSDSITEKVHGIAGKALQLGSQALLNKAVSYAGDSLMSTVRTAAAPVIEEVLEDAGLGLLAIL